MTMNCCFYKLCILILALVMAAEFGSAKQNRDDNPEFDVQKVTNKPDNKVEAKPSETTRGALGQGFEIHKIDLLTKQLEATGAKIFENLDECTITASGLGGFDSDEKVFNTTEFLYRAARSSTEVSASLQGEYTLGLSVSAVTGHIVGGNTEISGILLYTKATSISHTLKKDCINKQPLDGEFVKDFEGLDKKIEKPWLLASWRKYKIFLEKYGSHIVKETLSGSSIYQYVFAKSTDEFSKRDLTVKGCVSLAGPTDYGKLNISACSGISKEEVETSSEKTMARKLVVRGGTPETRADVFVGRTEENIKKFLEEGETDPSPISYSFYPIWTILQARYIGTPSYAHAANLEQFYKGFLDFGCSYKKTSNQIEMQKFDLSKDSQPEAPTYVCKLAPQGCHVDADCHEEAYFWCSCHGESCLQYRDLKLNSGSTKKEAYVWTASYLPWNGCHNTGKFFYTCTCDPGKNWKETWSGDTDNALRDINRILVERRRDQHERLHANKSATE